MKKTLSILLILLLTVTLLAGCTQDSGDTPSSSAENESQTGDESPDTPAGVEIDADKDTLVFVSHMTSETLDPISGASFDKNAMHQLFDTLLRLDENGNVAPRLAESWEESEDMRSIIFKLREDVVFHDGTPFNADAVVFTFESMLDNPLVYMTTYVSGATAIDEYTVEITKGSSYANVMNYLAEQPFIVSPTAYEADPEGFAKNPVGTGAYIFESQGSDGYVHMTANPDYFGGEPYFKNLTLRTPLDASTALVALQNGEVDIAIQLLPNLLPIAEDDENLTAVVSDGWSLKTVMMMGGPFTDNAALREAVSYAINRENAAIYNEEEGAEPATNLYSKRVMGEYDGIAEITGYDPERAKEILEESGYTDDTVIMIKVSADYVNIAQSIQADLTAVGISAEIQQLDTNAYYEAISDGECELTVVDFGTDQTSAEDMMAFFTSTGYYGAYAENSAEYDQILMDVAELYDINDRMPLVQRALELQAGFYNIVPLYESSFNYVHNAGLTGFNPISASTYVYYLGDIKPA